jgi:3-deoxy-manno-octulosonate cytidylyltransferase (CMP-KDO synthetase)
MNLQGDEPAINIEDIINLNKKMTIYQVKWELLLLKLIMITI